MYTNIRNTVTNHLVKSISTFGKKIIKKYIENIKSTSLFSEKKKINNSDVLRDIITKKSKNINILLGANVHDINSQKRNWDLCISNGSGIKDGRYQQTNFPSYQEIDENKRNIPGQIILDWNKSKDMEELSVLNGKVDLIVFDWSSSGSEFWNGELGNLTPLLQVNGNFFIEEYTKTMELVGNFLMPIYLESYLNGIGCEEYNSLFKNNMESIVYREKKNKILFGEKNNDKNTENIYREGGIFNLDINKNLLIEPCYKNTGPIPILGNVISLFRDVYIQTIPEKINYYLNYQELIKRNNNIISTFRLSLNIKGKQKEEFFPKSTLQFNPKLNDRLIKRRIITSEPQFKYFYKRTRKSTNEKGELVEQFPKERFDWVYPILNPNTEEEIKSFHVIQRLY